ncbi:MAG: glycosyltransferase family 2 protein [Nitrospirae bacterium]|nr:glycosyltransferase family 2 protein [Nitrospirota bacterium]
MRKRSKVVVVMPAYNAEKTLHLTYRDLPKGTYDSVILVDDGSTDRTAEIARELGLEVFLHNRNYGYGANQKTCYREALKTGADVIVMVHPDYQYDPKLLPEMVEPIERGDANIVLGSRLLVDDALSRGMPWWKYVSNRLLTQLENWVLHLKLSEYHTGYRAFSRRVLETIPFEANSDGFIFDQELIFQAVHLGYEIREIPVPARYFPDASSASFLSSVVYGLGILVLIGKYGLHRLGLRGRLLESLTTRYTRAGGEPSTRGDPLSRTGDRRS